LLTISIIIPVKPGLTPVSLQRIAQLDWPREQLELFVSEGCNPSLQRNEAVKQATGDVVYFLDDDSLVKDDCLVRISQHFKDQAVVAAGGPSVTPDSDSVFQRAAGIALSSLLGAGGVRNRYRQSGVVRACTERELILCNLAVRRDAFLSTGGFDQRLYPNEENEFLDRLAAAGGRILHDPELAVSRSQRRNIFAFIKQMFRYGMGRARQTRIGGIRSVTPFVPLLFVLYLLGLPFAGSLFLFLPLFVYLLGAVVTGVSGGFATGSTISGLLSVLLIPVLHISNGAGLLAGFILPKAVKPCYKDVPVSVRRIELV
jgi:succinoglycan biosynthesis protein ExoA